MSGASVPVAELRELVEQLRREIDTMPKPDGCEEALWAAQDAKRDAAERILHLVAVAEVRAAHAIDPLDHLRATVREVDRLGGLDCCCTVGCTTPRCAAVARLRGLV